MLAPLITYAEVENLEYTMTRRNKAVTFFLDLV